MSCAAEDIKRKVVSADPFQTPKRQEASAFDAFNGFFVLSQGEEKMFKRGVFVAPLSR